MIKPAYLSSIEEALRVVTAAEKDAIALLPAVVTKKHWVLKKHSPGAWLDVAFWYQGQEPYDQTVAHTIDAVASLVLCRSYLQQILNSYRLLSQPINLTLPKTRRIQ